MSALTRRLPENSSRTSTHAISVPVTTFRTTTTSDTTRVKRIAASACGPVTACQNAAAPPLVDSATTAASGSRTTRLRYAVASAPPTAGPEMRGRARGGARTSARADTEPRLDPLHDGVRGIEELLHHAVPAAELRDVEAPRGVGVLLPVD